MANSQGDTVIAPAQSVHSEGDDFLNWDPWGDDAERYPNGFWHEQSEDTPLLTPPSTPPPTASETDVEPARGDPSEVVEPKDHNAGEPAKEDKECSVCLEIFPTGQLPDLTHAAGDQKAHGSDVCAECWNQHLESEIESKGFEGVSCLQCPQKLTESEVRKSANSSIYSRYVLRTKIKGKVTALNYSTDTSTMARKDVCSRMRSTGPAPAPLVSGVCRSISHRPILFSRC